jgi:hypothetical protein
MSLRVHFHHIFTGNLLFMYFNHYIDVHISILLFCIHSFNTLGAINHSHTKHTGRQCLFIGILNECLRLPNEGSPHPLEVMASRTPIRHASIIQFLEFPMCSWSFQRILAHRFHLCFCSLSLLSDHFPYTFPLRNMLLICDFYTLTYFSLLCVLLYKKNAGNEVDSDPMGIVSRKLKNSVKYCVGGYKDEMLFKLVLKCKFIPPVWKKSTKLIFLWIVSSVKKGLIGFINFIRMIIYINRYSVEEFMLLSNWKCM